MKFYFFVIQTAMLLGGLNLPAQTSDANFFRNFSLVNGNVYQKSAELQTWVQGQNQKTRSELDPLPLMSAIKARFAELAPTNPPVRFSVPGKEFYLKAGSLFVFENGLERLLVDKTSLLGSALADFKVSPDGKKILYAKILNGSDSMFWSVFDTESNTTLQDTPSRVRIYDIHWGLDSKGYYYTQWPDLEKEFSMVQAQKERTKGNDVAYHALGTPSGSDPVVFENPNVSANYIVNEVPGSTDLIAHRTKLGFTHKLSLYLGKKSGNRYQWKNLNRSNKILGRVVTVTEKEVYVLTSESGNNYGVVAYSLCWPYLKRSVVKADSRWTLSQAQRVGDFLVMQYFDKNFENLIRTFNMKGKLHDQFLLSDLGLPARGAIAQSLSGSFFSERAYFAYSAMEKAPVTISYDPAIKAAAVLKNDKEVPFDGNLIKSQVYEFRSADGVQVPIQLYTRTDRSPLFVYVNYYGSNGIVNPSVFNRKLQLMLELGGAVAMVGTRGGGDRGADWYNQGMQNRKLSVQDVAWASRWLKQFLPSIRDNVVASGRSYGGMLSYMALTQFPEDFKLVVPVVGIGDLKYYMNDYHGSIGWDDLGFDRDADGQIVDTVAKRQEVLSISPIENIKKMKSSPMVLSFTAESDERVGPHQTYLMTYELQTKFPSQTILMFDQAKAGHNARSEAIDEAAFISKVFELKDYWPLK